MKSGSKSLIGIILVLALAVFNGAPGRAMAADGPAFKFKVSIQDYEGYLSYQNTMQALSAITEKTGGQVTFDIFPGSVLGDYLQIYEEVMQGSIDIANLAAASQYSKVFDLPYMPYLATSVDELNWLFTNEKSYLYKEYTKATEGRGCQLLNILGNGFMGLGSVKPIDPGNIYDFSVKKNLLVRIPVMDQFIIFTPDMGLNPTAIPYSEAYSALQTGVVDGWLGGNPESNFVGFKDVIKTYVHLQYGYEVMPTIMNLKKFQSLPPEYQKIFREAFHEAGLEQVREKYEADLDYIKKLEELGIKTYVPTAEQLAAMAAYIREKSWPKLYKAYGQETVDNLFNDYANMKP